MRMQININNLSFAYGTKTIITNLSLSLNSGDYLVVRGKNGSGKSTFIKCLLGFNQVKSGMIFFDKVDITEFKSWTKFGYVSQNFDDFNYEFPLTVGELLQISSLKKTDESTRLKLLEKMGIFDIINQNINSLSGGQLQRVFIVRAMLNNPEVLILDEPTASIDKQNKEFFYDTVEELHQLGITIVLITHTDDIERLNYTHLLSMYGDLTTTFEERGVEISGGVL
ncbi:MAG: metal ABC transporter ATP-binding protein [Candidatus Izemoplasmatales bacterium]|nr:metal ABC transporter ATP-binding protein [Candidatus Izemoplasmatales bacterium]MDD4070588.1 metal ABC transporter ATP-binding protein [Candidatus Izemoplasmatales bacterium]MDY0139410.1 metal ABC transporter ATP-binding protein [Candidatus Izemoplasmatales bacterium]